MWLVYCLLHLLQHMLEVHPIKIKKGVIRNPPPTPNNPERIPTIVLRKKIVDMLTVTSAMGRKTSIYFFQFSIKKVPKIIIIQ